MLRTRAYVRYSDHKQDDGYSVEYQVAEIGEYVIRNGLDLQKTHIDQAISGTKVAGRDAFFELLHDVKEGHVDAVVVYKLNRMFRNAYESQKYRKLFKKHGVKLMSVTQQIDEDTSAGRLMTNVLSDIDQYQSETISDHVKSSMREMVRQGYHTGGSVPFGYDLDSVIVGNKTRSKYKPHETERHIVKKMFELYADNYSLRYLQEYLTERGIVTRQNKMFGTTSIARILANDFYIGTRRYSCAGYEELVIPNAFEPIIDMSLWNKVQARKQADKLPSPRKKKDLYALTGKIFCAYCDSHFFGIRSGSKQGDKYYDYKYYVCAENKNYKTCQCKRIRKEFIEDVVLSEIKRQILNEDAIKRLAREIMDVCDNSPDDISTKLKRLKKRKSEIENGLDELLDMKMRKLINERTLIRKSAVLETELQDVESQIYMYQEQERNSITFEGVTEYLNKMLANSETTDENVLKNLFDNFVEKIVVSNERVDVYLYVRPLGVLEFKRHSGHPQVNLYAKFKRQ